MRNNEPDKPTPQQMDAAETAELLRREVEELKRQLREQKASAGAPQAGLHGATWYPSAGVIWAIFLGITALIVTAFFAGYIPLQKRNALIESEAVQQVQSLPRVEVIQVRRATPQSELELPGNIQAITEAPILARADGYIRRRLVDIGDRVKAGQTLAEIEAPEMDQQIRQAQAAAQQAQAALDQAQANYEQGRTNMELARITAERWKELASQGVVSQQDDDQRQAQYKAGIAAVQALEKAIGVQRSNVAAAEANVARLSELKSYQVVKAPFDGVITVRNVDVGALVNSGSTLLFRIAQTGTLRTYVNVPQTNANFIQVGQMANLTVANLPGRTFQGTVSRTANALDPASRTMLVEVQVPNPDGALLPGMYAQVELRSPRLVAPILVPGDALVVRAEGTLVAVVGADHTVHLRKLDLGKDYGDRIEVLDGLRDGETIIPNPGDLAREGLKVEPVLADEKSEGKQSKPARN
jgi:RND family efflux transporter MFP subunit